MLQKSAYGKGSNYKNGLKTQKTLMEFRELPNTLFMIRAFMCLLPICAGSKLPSRRKLAKLTPPRDNEMGKVGCAPHTSPNFSNLTTTRAVAVTNSKLLDLVQSLVTGSNRL